MTNPSLPEPVDLTDPAIEPFRLQQLAQTHPHLWNDILDHPNVYPGLADWIRDRQAEQTAAAPQASAEYAAENTSDDVADDTADEVADAAPVEPAGEEFPTAEPTEQPDEAPTNSWFQHPSPEQPEADQTDQTPAYEEPTQPFSNQGQTGWAQPSPAEPMPQSQQFGASSPQDSGQVSQGYAYDQPSYGFNQSHQTQGYQQQQPQQPQYTQPFMNQPRAASKIDLSSRGTWGLFIAGGAAFLALFGFFFSPSVAPSSVLGVSHFSSGGWLLMLLLIGTVAMSVIELLMPNRWTRYAFVALGIGTAFALIGRYMTVVGFLAGYRVGFSLVWLIFMALVLLAGTMVYFAPDGSTSPSSPQQKHQQPQQFQQHQPQNSQFNQPGSYPQSGQFPQGGYGQQPQQFGGYQPPHQPGSPQ